MTRGCDECLRVQFRPRPHAKPAVVNEYNRQTPNVRRLFDCITRGARNVRNNGAIASQQLIEQNSTYPCVRTAHQMVALIPRRRICPSSAVRSNSSMKLMPSASRRSNWSLVFGAMSSSGKSMCGLDYGPTRASGRRAYWLIRRDSLPANCSLAAARASSVRE